MRNAGNAITDCAIRSLFLTIDVLGAEEIVLIGHRMCEIRVINTKKLQKIAEDRIEAEVSEMMGQPFKNWLQLATDPETNLMKQARIIFESKLIPKHIPITGLMYDEYNGHLYKVFGPLKNLPE
jgi:carbonic anhydrase